MSVNLITGYAGEAHVTSQDDGAVNAGVIGNGKYVLNIGQKFAYETISNNLIRIKDGYMINQGRKIGIKINDYEDVTIDNGLQSVKRSDLIVMRYTKNADTGIEIAEVVVIKGTSGDSYVDPEHTTGDILAGDLVDDFPLYRVKLSGLQITGVDTLFTISKTVKELEADINTVSNITIGKADNCKNLFEPTWTTHTSLGITYTVNEDKSITVNGTATANTFMLLMDTDVDSSPFDKLTDGITYRISSNKSTKEADSSFMYIVYEKDNMSHGNWNDYGLGDGPTITLDKTYRWFIAIQVQLGETVTNATFYPMIRNAEITDSTYEQYYPTLKEVGTKLGTTDISAIGDGTVTGGISALNSANTTVNTVTSTVGTVIGGYVVVGNVVFINVSLTITGTVTDGTSLLEGLPIPLFTYSPMLAYDITGVVAIGTYVLAQQLKSRNSIATSHGLKISGSYIKA